MAFNALDRLRYFDSGLIVSPCRLMVLHNAEAQEGGSRSPQQCRSEGFAVLPN